MAYLGAIAFTEQPSEFLVWSRYVIASAILDYVIGQYATYGGYVYVG